MIAVKLLYGCLFPQNVVVCLILLVVEMLVKLQVVASCSLRLMAVVAVNSLTNRANKICKFRYLLR